MIDTRSFTPGQAAKISGVNAALQRDWRRRGILPPLKERSAAFSPVEVAEMMVLNALAERGGGPSHFKGVSGKLGAAVLRSALLQETAYAGPANQVVHPDVERLEYALSFVGKERDEQVWAWRASWLAEGVVKRAGYPGLGSAHAFFQWADGSFDFYRSLQEPFDFIDVGDPRVAGAIIALDLRTLGMVFAQRSGPIVDVSPSWIEHQDRLPGLRRVTEMISTAYAADGANA